MKSFFFWGGGVGLAQLLIRLHKVLDRCSVVASNPTHAMSQRKELCHRNVKVVILKANGIIDRFYFKNSYLK